MDKRQIKHIIAQGENEQTEFKQNFNRQTIETLVAFANSTGGHIIIGVSDKHSIVGAKITKESIANWQNEIKSKTQPAINPDIKVFTIEQKTVISISVQEYPVKPVAVQGRYFIRKNNSNHLLTADEIAEIRFTSLNYSFDAFEVSTSFKDLDKEALTFFQKRITESGRFNFSGNLKEDFKKLGFIRNNKLTRAGELLFGTHHTAVHVGRFKSDTEIIDDIVIRSPLIVAVEEAINFIKRNILYGFIFGGEGLKRQERWQYPIPVIRELLLNAVVHRDYTNPTDVIIKIFDNTIEIVNPGKLMGGLTIDDLLSDNYQARHRNKLLAEAFYLTGDIEKYGTGFRRIRAWLNDYPEICTKFTDLKDLFRADISIKQIPSETDEVTDRVTDKVTDKVTDNQKRILELISENPYITTKKMADSVGISQRKIKENIAKLKEQDIIKRIGSNKTGHWQIIEE